MDFSLDCVLYVLGFSVAQTGVQSDSSGIPGPCWWDGHRYGDLKEFPTYSPETGHEVQAGY